MLYELNEMILIKHTKNMLLGFDTINLWVLLLHTFENQFLVYTIIVHVYYVLLYVMTKLG